MSELIKKESHTFTTSTGASCWVASSKGCSPVVACVFCQFKSHVIMDCQKLMALSVDERKKVITSKRLCYGCLSSDHMVKECKSRITCHNCKRNHSTCLHGDMQKTGQSPNQNTQVGGVSNDNNETQSEPIRATTSVTSATKSYGIYSMIIPVYLSHQENPQNEVLTYAMMDSQSDTTFVKQNVCHELEVQGQDIDLLLSTMFSEDECVHSFKIKGMSVWGYDSEICIALPATYTRAVMPANRGHIPSAGLAASWPHLLERIADKLMPLASCDVGLLIGYNCPWALVPREILTCDSSDIYGQWTDLGWGIVGSVGDITRHT